jgi:hypothetical protein
MAETPNRALVDALIEHGRAETPAQLAARGVKHVRSVSLQRVSRLIDQAIQNTLMERSLLAPDAGAGAVEGGAQATSADKAVVLEHASARFQQLLGAGRALESSSQAIGAELGELELELAALRERPERESAVVERRKERSDEHRRQDKLVGDAIAEVLGVLGSRLSPEAGGELGKVEGKVVEICLALIRDERQRALAAEVTAYDRQVELLERRIAKLVETLRRVEVALGRVKALKHVDDGIESIFRVVQGLDVGAEDAGRKKALLSEIFKANLELRRQCGEIAPVPGGASVRRAEELAA